jgi:hypothetical protein
MANQDRKGAIAVDTLTGAPMTARTNRYEVAAANDVDIFPGDFLELLADGTVKPLEDGVTEGTTNVIIGVCAGIEVAPPAVADGFLSNNNIGVSEHPGYLPALTAGFVNVIDDPNQLFLVQADGILATTAIGSNFAVEATIGSTVTGRSGHQIDASSIVQTTEQLRLIRKYEAVDNDVALTNAKWIVKINEHQHTTAAGV